MWRSGRRPPLDGVIIHGGSDWLVLPREFCSYVAHGTDDLVVGLRHWFGNSVLPAESFFHTLAYNSHFCNRVINSNLRLTNWKRPRGCGCKTNAVADWCGCSPSVFTGSDGLNRLHHTNRPFLKSLFARKFDSTIDVAIINVLEQRYLQRELPGTPSKYPAPG